MIAMLFVVLVACDGGEVSDTSTDTDTDTDTPSIDDTWTLSDLGGSCDSSEKVGAFEVAHWDGYATLTGNVASGVIPATILTALEEENGCRLFERENPFCDPTCDPGEVCTHDGECIPYPSNLDVGAVTVAGLSESITLTADTSGYYWDTTVGWPLFNAGDLVQMTAVGGSEVGEFSLRGLGVDDLVVGSENWEIVSGEDLEITWTPSVQESRIRLSFNVDQHGNSPVTMYCDVEDTGSAQVSGALLNTLLNYGVSGFATGTARRQTVDSLAIETGCVEMSVYHHVAAQLSVSGHTPCYSDNDCPDGQVCDVPINTCVDAR